MKKQIFIVPLLASMFFTHSCLQPQSVQGEENNPAAKNIIFLIGDGMGLNQVLAAMTVAGGDLAMEHCNYTGLQITHSADNYITDSAASGTAMACGKKTYNGAIGVDTDTSNLISILKIAEESGKATGLVSTSSITHATPASFIANEKSRNMYEAIAADFLKTDVDVVIGGGQDHFMKRKDGRNLADELRAKGYTVCFSMDTLENKFSDRIYCLTAAVHNPPASEGRGNMLPRATKKALELLSKNENGFFIMIEGSQIDWGGHANNQEYNISETIDFDQAVREALDFAREDGQTLVVVTADHETGGMVVLDGNYDTGEIETVYTTEGHTASLIPVFANGPGAELFTGVFQNSGFKERFLKAYGLDE